MIELFISSPILIEATTILKVLMIYGVECNITTNISSVPNECANFTLEYGFHLKLFNINESNFKKKVWNLLQPILKLKCAYVRHEHKYMGCVLNWPGVFVKTQCEGSNDCSLDMKAF